MNPPKSVHMYFIMSTRVHCDCRIDEASRSPYADLPTVSSGCEDRCRLRPPFSSNRKVPGRVPDTELSGPANLLSLVINMHLLKPHVEEIETTEHALLRCPTLQYARGSFPETVDLRSAWCL